ncbi:MAG TPA: DUF192 domain-containing protein [Longimicrobiales bacterium]|nr:DUF192 domain-containing protein [Longimicrobiales bacterium]
MSFVRVVNESRQKVLGGRIRLVHSLRARMRGFLFRRAPRAGEGLFLAPCRGVHTYWMRFPLDVILIDETGNVVAAHAGLRPGTRTPIYRAARFALELPAGSIEATDTMVGDRLSWKPVVEVQSSPPPADGASSARS